MGHRRAGRPAGRHRRAWARSAGTWPATCSTTAPTVVVTDVSRRRGRRGHAPRTRRSTRSPTPTRWSASDIDVYAPCALGGALERRRPCRCCGAKVVCGAANNQLAHPGIEKLLADRGILYAPDYVVNAGGVIQVADEIEGFELRAGQAGRPGSSTPPGRSCGWPTRRASRRRWRPTGWPSGGWPRSAGCARSWSRAVTVDALRRQANVPLGGGRLRQTGRGRSAVRVTYVAPRARRR